MGQRFKVNLLPILQHGEKVLFIKKWVGFCTCLSSPNYRWSFSLPPVQEQGLYVTDRRLLHILHLFRLLTVEFDQWFDENNPAQDTELIRKVRADRHWLCGPYLEIVSESTKTLWFRSRKTRMRLYMRKAESVCNIITEAIAGNTENQ